MIRSVIYNSFGESANILETVQEPKPIIKNDEQVLIKIRAVSVNNLDWKIYLGQMPSFLVGFHKPRRVGLDYSGIVEEIGSKVTDIAIGDEVFGTVQNSFTDGALSDYFVVKQDFVWKKPVSCSLENAAALPMIGCAALQTIETLLNVQEGAEVLINGCTGGMGSIAVQIAKKRGAIVTGVCSTKGIAAAQKYGCDAVFDYSKQEVLTAVELQLKFDVVIDMTAKWSLSVACPIMKPIALFVNVVPGVGDILTNQLFNIFGFANQQTRLLMTETNRERLRRLQELVDAGVQVDVAKTFTLGEVKEAFDFTAKGGVIGKVVIVLDP